MAVLRVSCEGNSTGASVSTNGQSKGRCPIDMEVPIGTVKIRATKKEIDDFERVFEDEVYLGSGVVQRVEVVLGGRRPSVALIKRWEAAASAGDAEAMYQLGFAYQWGTSGPIDFTKSTAYYGQAAEAGHPAGMSSYAGAIFSGRVPGKVNADGENWMAKALEKGDGDALTSLGMRYRFGDGAPPDPAKAKDLFLKAAKAGSRSAWYWLSDMEEDKSKAAELRERADQVDAQLADSGDMDAMSSVAMKYAFSQNSKPPAEAAEMKKKSEVVYAAVFAYRKNAAATGDAASLVRLGIDYRDGREGAPKIGHWQRKLSHCVRKRFLRGQERARKNAEIVRIEKYGYETAPYFSPTSRLSPACQHVLDGPSGTGDLLRLVDRLDQIDKQDFQALIERANGCTRSRDFACADQQLKKASSLAHEKKDKETLAVAVRVLGAEKSLAAREKAEAERREAQRLAEIEREKARREKQARNDERREACESRCSDGPDMNVCMRGLIEPHNCRSGDDSNGTVNRAMLLRSKPRRTSPTMAPSRASTTTW